MSQRLFTVIFICLLGAGLLHAQEPSLDDVRLFQNFYRDVTVAPAMYGEGGLIYDKYDEFSVMSIGARGGYPINPKIEVNAKLGFVSVDIEDDGSESGLADILVAGRYLLKEEPVRLAAGGFLTLPVGDEDILQGNLNFGAFGALRHALENGVVLTGTLGLNFIEITSYTVEWDGTDWVEKKETDHESSIQFGAGAILPLKEQLSLVGELNFMSEEEYILISGGLDYVLSMGGRVRGALGIGFDDGAPNFQLMGTYLHAF